MGAEKDVVSWQQTVYDGSLLGQRYLSSCWMFPYSIVFSEPFMAAARPPARWRTRCRWGQSSRSGSARLRDVTSYDGSSVLYTHQPEVLSDLELSDDTLAAIKKGMGDLVNKSLAGDFKNCIVTAGAKTGSAQVGDLAANGVFVCFAPFEDAPRPGGVPRYSWQAGGGCRAAGPAQTRPRETGPRQGRFRGGCQYAR